MVFLLLTGVGIAATTALAAWSTHLSVHADVICSILLLRVLSDRWTLATAFSNDVLKEVIHFLMSRFILSPSSSMCSSSSANDCVNSDSSAGDVAVGTEVAAAIVVVVVVVVVAMLVAPISGG